MSNSVEGLLEVYEDMVENLLVLEIFPTEIRRLKICVVMFHPALKPVCSSAMIFSYDIHEDLLTVVKRRKLQWYGHFSRSSGLTKIILQGTVKEGRRIGKTS